MVTTGRTKPLTPPTREEIEAAGGRVIEDVDWDVPDAPYSGKSPFDNPVYDYLNGHKVEANEHPFWVDVYKRIPPVPHDEKLMGLFNGLSRAQVSKLWQEWEHNETGQDAAETGPEYYRLSDYANLKFETPIWRIENICGTQGVGIIAGPPKHGKTAFCIELGLCIASGVPFMDYPVLNPAPVLYIEQEGNEEALRRHIVATANARGINLTTTPFFVRHRKPTRIDTPEGIARIRALITETGAKVVFIGPLAYLHRQTSEDDSALMAPLMATFDSIATDLEAFVFPIHHTRKASGFDVTRKPSSPFAFFEKVRGSGVFIGHVDVALGLWRAAREAAGTLYVLNRDGRDYMAPYAFDPATGVFTPRVVETADERQQTETERHIELLIDEHGARTIEEAAIAWGCVEKTARRKMGLYLTQGLVIAKEDPSDKRRLLYTVTDKGLKAITFSEEID